MPTHILRIVLLATTAFGSVAAAQTPLSDEAAQAPASGVPAGSASASAPNSGPAGTIEDIIVTARRQEESIQRTPVAVTAIGTEAIKNAQIVDAISVQRTAPSLSVQTGSPGNSGFTYISIRGAGTLNPGVANDPAVAIYVDGVYIPRPSQGVTELNDIARVEVLRGPQGTLFGRNTTGGAINVISADPTAEFGGQVRAQVGNYDYRNIGGILNLPIMGDELSARLVYDFTDRDGYGHNATLDRDSNDRRSHFARAKLRWAPGNGDWSFVLSGDYNKITDHGQFVGLGAFSATANPLIGAVAPTLAQYLHTKESWYTNYGQPRSNNPYTGDRSRFVGPDRFTTGNLPYDFLEAYGGALTVTGRVGNFDVKSISAYRYSNSIGLNDLDGTPVQILSSESFYLSDQYSQELQLSGNLTDRLSFILGGYYSTEKGAEGSLAQTFGSFGPAAPAPNFGYGMNLSDVKNESLGAFGQAYYQVTDALRLTAGLRWTWDTREVVLHNVTNVALNSCSPELTIQSDFEAPCTFARKAKFDYPAWTFGVDYQANDDIFIYGVTRRASKAGGFNIRNGSANTPPFAPEKVEDVEFGLKMTSPDRRARANVALFYSWQSGVQRNANALVPIGGSLTTTQYLQNAGKQEVYGAEIELGYVPWEGMTLAANLSLLDGFYVPGSFTEVRDIPGANLPGCAPVPGNAAASRCIVDRSSETIPQLPKTQLNLSATQKIPLDIGKLTLFVNYAYIGSQVSDTQTADPRQSADVRARLAEQDRLAKIKGYGLLDARVSLELDNPGLEIFAFARNITGEKYVTRRFVALYSSLGTALDYIGSPSVYGVGATFRFGTN